MLSRGVGPWGPKLVRGYTSTRFGERANGGVLNDEESRFLAGNHVCDCCHLLDMSVQVLTCTVSCRLCVPHRSSQS